MSTNEGTPGKGHNSKGGASGEQLRSIVQRIETLNEEIKDLQGDRRDLYAEAKGAGFDVKVLRKFIQRRAMDPTERDEQDMILETYEGIFG